MSKTSDGITSPEVRQRLLDIQTKTEKQIELPKAVAEMWTRATKHHTDGRDALGHAYEHALKNAKDSGEALAKLQDEYTSHPAYGSFYAEAKKRMNASRRTVQNYMSIAKNWQGSKLGDLKGNKARIVFALAVIQGHNPAEPLKSTKKATTPGTKPVVEADDAFMDQVRNELHISYGNAKMAKFVRRILKKNGIEFKHIKLEAATA